MTTKKQDIEEKIKDKIRSYNRQRTTLSSVTMLCTGIVFFSSAIWTAVLPVRVAVFISAILILSCAAFILPLYSSILLLLTATCLQGVLLGLQMISQELFLLLLLINIGIIFIGGQTTHTIIQTLTSDLEELKQLETEATTDNLTQLLNRNGLEQAASTALAFCKRDQKTIGVILADIDYFKVYNDTLGHLEGDNVLKQVTKSIKHCFRRETDIISRIGGDEFLILLPDVDDGYLVEMAQTLSLLINDLKIQSAANNDPCDFLSITMGIVSKIPQAEDSLTRFYHTADQALYHAKKAGRNCISFQGSIIQGGPQANEDTTSSLNGLAYAAVGQNEKE